MVSGSGPVSRRIVSRGSIGVSSSQTRRRKAVVGAAAGLDEGWPYAEPALYDVLHARGTAAEVDGLERIAAVLRSTVLRPFVTTQETLTVARSRAADADLLSRRLDSLVAARAAEGSLAEENRRLRALLRLSQKLGPTFVSMALTLMAVPIMMVLVSAAAPARVARAANLVVAALYVPVTVFNAASEPLDYAYFYGLSIGLELLILGYVLRSAWAWPRR